MNFKTTVILLILLVGAGAFVAYDRLNNGDKDNVEASADSKRLFDVKKSEDVNSLTIKPADGNEIVLAKAADGKWRMTKPVEAAAEAWQVDGLVRDLIELESKASVDPKDKGLDKPKLNVEISAKNGKLVKFAVGDKNALGDMYVKVAGRDMAEVVSGDLYDRLNKPANELRDKQLVTTASADIRQLAIEAGGQKLLLQKTGAEWELTEPKKLPADAGTIADLLSAVTGLRASDWVAKDSPEVSIAQFDKPQMIVSFTTAAPTTRPATTTTAPAGSQPTWTTVTFGQFDGVREQKVYARLSDTQAVVKIAGTPIATLTKKPIELRDKRVLDIVPEQVSKMSILTDLPGGPAPTTKPGKRSEVVIERRKQLADAVKPAATQGATTKSATTQPTAATQASTTQAVAAKPPASTWELKSDPKGDADDDAIKELLADLHPLRVAKYFEATPTTKPAGNYVIRLTTEGPGGTPVTQHEIKLIDPGATQAMWGDYNGLSFEVPRAFLTKLEGNFAKKPKIDVPAGQPVTPDDFKLPGEP